MIRLLRQEDIEVICNIVNDNWKSVYAGYVNKELLSDTGCLQRKKELEKDFITGRLMEYVYEKNGQAVALLSMGNAADQDKAGAFEIWRIYIHKSFQGQGIGAELLGFAEQYALENGYSEIVIWAFKNNTRAVSFYQKHGYEIDKVVYLEEPYLADSARFNKQLQIVADDMQTRPINYIIRKMHTQEYPLLESFLYEAIFQRDETNLVPKTIIENTELQIYIEGFGSKKGDYCLCAEAAGKVVGAVWARIIPGYGNIDNETPELAISLYKDFRGYGIGTEMMKQMIAYLNQAGYAKVSLAVQKDNYAVNVYINTGFKIVDKTEEEYIMVYDFVPNCARILNNREGRKKMFRYVHTNIIARDVNCLITFYKEVFHCQSVGETRNLRGVWLDKMTGIKNSHITGEHLVLPGWGDSHPTLEIFSYDEMKNALPAEINRPGIAHIAFEVDDVKETLNEMIKAGGSAYGELVTADYPGGVKGTFIYAQDPEGNIVELQSWEKTADLSKEK